MVCLEQNMNGDTNVINLWKNKDIAYENYKLIKRINFKSSNNINIIGITRIRNEESIIEDTLNHMDKIVDKYIVLDDCSTDKTVKFVKKNKKVIEIIENNNWENNRVFEETHQRSILLERARKYKPKWIFYFDADERFEINKKEILDLTNEIDGIRIRLFDAYITTNDKNSYTSKQQLYGFRKFFGPEYRDILMIFRNNDYIEFQGLDAREPWGCKSVITKFYCQHYGKSISVEQWEDTCKYYYEHFPEPYKSKWKNRMGKAVHELSDFGNRLYSWEEVKNNSIQL